jgi:hypothetical protein
MHMLTTRKLAVVTAFLGLIALAAGAVPAFTADSGTVTASISVPAPPVPCLTVTPTSLDYGTQPFSTNNGAGLNPIGTNLTVNFCGTAAGQNLLASTTAATGPSGSWTPSAYNPGVNPCPSVNVFYLEVYNALANTSPPPAIALTSALAPVPASLGGPPEVFPSGDQLVPVRLTMPCQGSNGAGETKTFTVTFTAAVA